MTNLFWSKLFDFSHSFDHPVTVGISVGLASLLILTPIAFELLSLLGRLKTDLKKELYARYLSWLWLIPLICGPILLGPGCTILAVGILSLLCYSEFARATGFFRSHSISFVIVLGILLLIFAQMDHWYGLFAALPSLIIIFIVVAGLIRDEPSGYIQRVALGVFGFLLFGVCLGYLGYMANDKDFRPLILTVLLCVEMNDIFAFVCGKLFGRRKLAPKTSPNKTIGGSLGAMVLTTGVFFLIGSFLFENSVLHKPSHIVAMGLIISITGQFGDLVISSIKRDLGIKDMGALIPGHGGLLDRFDSLLLTAPAIFHYVQYYQGIGLDQPTRIFTGS